MRTRARATGFPILTTQEVLKKLPQHGITLLAWEEEKATSLKQVLR